MEVPLSDRMNTREMKMMNENVKTVYYCTVEPRIRDPDLRDPDLRYPDLRDSDLRDPDFKKT